MPDALPFALAALLAIWGAIVILNAANPRNKFATWQRLLGWTWAALLLTAAYTLAPLG